MSDAAKANLHTNIVAQVSEDIQLQYVNNGQDQNDL